MGSEIVGSNLPPPSPPPPPPPLFANPNHQQQQQSIEPLRNNLQNPLPRTVSPSSPTTLSSGGGTIITIPDMQCPCGGGICNILTSQTEKNPGRQFYKCPRRPACRFFRWCDERSSSDQRVRVAVSPYPMCSCGAGPCNRLKVKKEGNNKGRFFFVCPVTKGQGACNFFQWEDETKPSPRSTLAVQESPEMVKKTVKQYGNEFKESFSPGSVVRGSESTLTEDYPVKEGEVGKSNSGGVHVKILSPMRNLRGSEGSTLRGSEGSNTSPAAKPGQWTKECFKCGETGHWMKDCTA